MNDPQKPAQTKLPQCDHSSTSKAAEPLSGTPPNTSDSTSSVTREVGGRKGPDPTRYGDWEKGGRCIDF